MNSRFVLLPETDAVPGALIDPDNPSAFFTTVTVGSATYKTGRYVNGVADPAFVSELPPDNYHFSTEHVDETLPSLRVDNNNQDLVMSVIVDGQGPSDVLRLTAAGLTLYPWPNQDIAQDANRLPVVLNFQNPPAPGGAQ